MGLMASFAWANGQWRVMSDTSLETTSIELSTLERGADRVSFRMRHALRTGPLDPDNQRPMREILAKRMVDCRGRRVATISHAVFSDNDALISYRAVRPAKAEWKTMKRDDPLLRLVCETL